jgi:hypothetical protein
MTSPGFSSLLDLYQQVLAGGVKCLTKKGRRRRQQRSLRVYCVPVVLWLMILQRLHAVGTLAAAVQLLLQGAADPLLPNCRRVRERKISAHTGGYCQARRKLPALLCKHVNREMTAQLRKMLSLDDPDKPRVYLLDGSSLDLEHSRELVRKYPPARNQHGTSHRPVLRMVVLHELESGLAEEPQWGPMYGPKAVSEQQLAEKAMDQLPSQAVLMGDSNFGVLWVAHAASQRGLATVLRLTEMRARKLMGGPISSEGEHRVVWKASRWDGGKTHCVPPDAAVEGRLIAARVGRGKSKQWLYLFTTLDWPAEEIVALYGCRWNIETDLRSLKRTVRLHHVTVKSNDMLEKELLMATAAYNLVRAVMYLAARQNHIAPRQLSFSMVLNVVHCAWHKLAGATSTQQFQQELARILDIAAQCKLPQRKHHRSYPRAVWRHRPAFPARKEKTT